LKIYFELTIPDDQVAIAQENGPGPNQDLTEWIVQYFDAEARPYFTDNLDFEYSLRIPHPQEIYTYLHFNLRKEERN
jgi:hypothetical protein